MEETKEEKLDHLAWALRFMQEYEKKLMQKARQIVKRQRKEKEVGIIRQTYVSKP